MKKIYVPFAIPFLLLISSCTKDTPISVVPKADTLTAGWKKIIVDPSETYGDVYFGNNTTGYLTGGKTYKSIDGGLNWNSISNQSFINLSVTSNGNAFFAGGLSGLFKSTNGTSPLINVKPFLTVSNSDVFFVDNNNGYCYESNEGLFNSTDGGENWTKLTTTGVDFASGLFHTLFFSSNNTGWVTTNNTVYKTNGSSSNWVAASFTGTAPKSLFTSVFSTPDNTVYTLASNRELYKSTNGGTLFSRIQTFQEPGGAGDIFFIDNNIGYVSVGNKIYKTTDAGSTWTVVVTLADALIVEIHFSDARHGWASGSKGTVLVYSN